ncbi:MAG: SDR family oxidoreductase [Planctomycetota bacterium]|nr:SDR family oxidoreductase [Planctomycetota bacterium]MCZ6697830.1 SDR family oxidoreductase [Planctomycetota bacterium]MCZ6816764.1 SDR family oxidoreductase [Planctomycetota bacterium]
MIDLKDSRAIVCGSSRGIGFACAEAIAGCGATVTLVARNEASLEAAREKLPSGAGQSHDFVCADFTDPPGLREAVANHLESIGPVNILVNNTGGPPSGPLVDAAPDAISSAISNHVICYQLLVQVVVPGMAVLGWGRIINIISTSVIAPIRGLGVSNTTRGAVANWGRTLAGELGPMGITVNNILPGYTDTVRLGGLIKKKAERAGKSEAEVIEDIKAEIPVGRLAEAREIGAVAAFLASPAASYVNGVNLPVDGGRTAWQ